MRQSLSWILFTSLAVVATAAAAEPTDKERIARLIAQLGSDQYDVRQVASKELDALGAPALDELKKACTSADDEIRHRAEILAHAISQRLEADRLLAPSRVRLVYKNIPITDAVADLGKKTGYNIQLDGDKTKLASKRITLDTGEVSFWDALTKFCDQAGLVEKTPDHGNMDAVTRRQQLLLQRRVIMMRGNGMVYQNTANPGDSTIHLKEGKGELMPACQSNAVRVRVLPGAPRTGEADVTCTLELTFEPKIQVQRVLAPQIQHAEDEKGLKLTYLPQAEDVPANPYETMIAWNGGVVPQAQLGQRHPAHFRLRDAAAKKIALLKGSILVQIVAPPGPLVTVSDIEKAAGKTFPADDGTSVKVNEVKREGDVLKLKIVLDTPVDAMQPWVNAAVFVNVAQQAEVVNEAATGLHLEDAKGKRIAATSVSNAALPVFNGRNTVNEYLLTYRIGKDQEAARLVLTGRRNAVLEVPFVLKDVPLTK
jgi:hypothetical protein